MLPKTGNLLVSDEYGPSVREFTRSGELVRTHTTPANLIPRNAGTGTPNFCRRHRQHRRQAHQPGFEGLAVSPDGNYAYAVLQSAMLDEGGGSGSINRIVKFDTSNRSGRGAVRPRHEAQ